MFSSWRGLEVTSAGTNHDAENPVTSEVLEWADIIIVMERLHRNKIQKKFRSSLNGKRIVCLEIPDEYEYMDPGLIRLLEAKVPKFLPAGAFNGA